MSHKYATLTKWINVLADYILLNLVLYIIFIIVNPDSAWMDIYDYRIKILLLNFSWFYCASLFKVYSNILEKDVEPTLIANIGALSLFTLFAFNIKFILPNINMTVAPLVSFILLFSIIIMLWRATFMFYRKYRRKFSLKSNKIVIVGAGPSGIDFYRYITENPQLGYDVVGFFDDRCSEVQADLNYLGRVEDCFSFASTNKIQEVFCALPTSEFNKIDFLIQQADNHVIRFRLIPEIGGFSNRNYSVELFGYRPILIPRQEPLDNKANEVVKRSFDILFSLLVILFILSWLTPLLAIIIKLDSKGPVFFRQLRSGKNNRPFYCLKFRSMAPNKDADYLQATRNDMRITNVGRFIRKTSIDELPQFFNVLLGDMSVVGPRPHMLKHTQDYSLLINNYMVRHFLTPGITGWAQVNGFRGETKETSAMLNRVQADLWYLENWTILLDLKIVALTVLQLFRNNENAL